MIKNVAFIGLGNMGTPLSRHLLNAGFNVSGYDVVKEKMGQDLRGEITLPDDPRRTIL